MCKKKKKLVLRGIEPSFHDISMAKCKDVSKYLAGLYLDWVIYKNVIKIDKYKKIQT